MSAAPSGVVLRSGAMRLTLRHVYDFAGDRDLVGDDLVCPEAWDNLRTRTTGPFAIPAERETWVAAAEANAALNARAQAIDGWLESIGAQSLASYGVGGGPLELLLYRRAPGRCLIATDFGPATVARLAGLFPEAEVREHDLLREPPIAADAHLLHRVDTELTDDEFRGVLRSFAGERLLVVATAVISPVDIALTLLQRARHRHLTRAGWARNRASFEALWRPTHDAMALPIHDLAAWDLRPRA